MSDYFFIAPTKEERIFISEAEAKHLVKVLRYGKGDTIYFSDGAGTRYTGILESIDYSNCHAKIIAREDSYGKRPYRLHIGISPTKNMERFEWFLEKATEIGIDEITPLLCARNERRDIRIDRLEKIIVSAMKQSSQCYLPRLNPIAPFSTILDTPCEQRFICHLDPEMPIALSTACKSGGTVLLVIGPEGDFTAEELQQAKEHSLHCVSLGTTRLRTETAGVVGCSIISQINQSV